MHCQVKTGPELSFYCCGRRMLPDLSGVIARQSTEDFEDPPALLDICNIGIEPVLVGSMVLRKRVAPSLDAWAAPSECASVLPGSDDREYSSIRSRPPGPITDGPAFPVIQRQCSAHPAVKGTSEPTPDEQR